MPDTEPPVLKKKRGCFFYGCLISGVVVLVGVVGLLFLGHFVVGKINQAIIQYTETAPVTLPKSDFTADQLKVLNARVQAFHDAVDAHSNTPPLTLTGPEVNALLSTMPELKSYKDAFYVTFEGEKAEAQISLPLDTLPPPLSKLNVKGRYLNGKGTFHVELAQGALMVNPETLEVKGQPLPANVMASFKAKNLAQNYNQSTNAAALQDYESVRVTNSLLVITPLAH